MLTVTAATDSVRIGPYFSVSFQRTLRVPDDGRTYPLPPSLGSFPVRRVADYADTVPAQWRDHGGVFLPMYQREALWLRFSCPFWHPNAVKVAAGKINAVSGRPWDQTLHAEEQGGQDYVVVPRQPWLDGFNAGKGTIAQFVAMPLRLGYTAEGQLSGEEKHGGLQIACWDAKPERFPTEAPEPDPRLRKRAGTDGAWLGQAPRAAAGGAAMGLAAGGRMKQAIHPDPYGIDTWDEGNFGRVFVHIVNSQMWRDITGEPLPPTPVSARSYTRAGLPWFEVYDADKGDIAPAEALQTLATVAEKDAEHGFTGQQDDAPVAVPPGSVHGTEPGVVPDDHW